MSVHKLKTWVEYFDAVDTNQKRFEIRKNDRDYKVGDTLYLEEYEPRTSSYTGRFCERIVLYMTKPDSPFAKDGYVVMSIIPKGILCRES